MFGVLGACHRDVGSLLKESLPTRLGEKGRFLCFVGVYTILWVMWDERNNGVFKGLERPL